MQSRVLMNLGKPPFENIEGKRENAGNQHFLLFPQYFLTFQRQSLLFEPHLICYLAFNLTLYHTVLTFNDPTQGRGLWKTLWEKKKMLVTSIFSFSHSVFYSIKKKIVILAMFKMSSANAFNLVMSKLLSFGKGLPFPPYILILTH